MTQDVVRLQRGPRFTARDLVTLKWIAEHGAVRFDHLQQLLALHSPLAERLAIAGVLSGHSTRRVLRRWLVEGLVGYKVFQVHEWGWVWLEKKGFRYLGIEGQACELTPQKCEKLFALNEQCLREELRGGSVQEASI